MNWDDLCPDPSDGYWAVTDRGIEEIRGIKTRRYDLMSQLGSDRRDRYLWLDDNGWLLQAETIRTKDYDTDKPYVTHWRYEINEIGVPNNVEVPDEVRLAAENRR